MRLPNTITPDINGSGNYGSERVLQFQRVTELETHHQMQFSTIPTGRSSDIRFQSLQFKLF